MGGQDHCGGRLIDREVGEQRNSADFGSCTAVAIHLAMPAIATIARTASSWWSCAFIRARIHPNMVIRQRFALAAPRRASQPDGNAGLSATEVLLRYLTR